VGQWLVGGGDTVTAKRPPIPKQKFGVGLKRRKVHFALFKIKGLPLPKSPAPHATSEGEKKEFNLKP